MIDIKKIKTTDAAYPFVEELLLSAFPKQERRDVEVQRYYTDNNPLFHCNVITDKGTPIGLITFWNFTDFCYIEHFATDAAQRNKGYGEKILRTFKAQCPIPIVLEAEEPTDEMSRRRIGFYQRQGFILQDCPYLQPPYRVGDDWFPLKLMTYGEVDMEKMYGHIKGCIYKEVYGV